MKLKPSKLMLVALTAAMGLTGCGKEPEPEPGPGDDTPEVARLLSISFEHETETIEEEGSIDLRILYNPSNISSSQKPLRYSSSNPDVAVVNENFGTVTGISAGKATITATSRVNPSITATCEITVTAKDRSIPVERVVLDRDEAAVSVGGYTYVNATVYGANNKLATDRRLNWSTDNPNIATIDGTDRKITGVGVGTAHITATSVADATKFDTITVVVTDSYIKVNSVTLDKPTLNLQDEDNPIGQLTVTVSSATANVKPTDPSVTWEALDSEGHTSDVVRVYVSGEATASIRALKAGEATIKVISNADATKYATCAVTVAEKGERDMSVHVTGIAFANDQQDTVQFGGSLPVNASVTPSNAGNKNIAFTLKEGSSLPEGTTFADGVITAGNVAGNFTIVATAEDTVNGTYTAEKTFYVVDPITHVTSLECSIEGSTTLYVGDQLSLAPGAGVVAVLPNTATDGAVEYAVSNPQGKTVVVVESDGTLRAQEVGSATVTISTHEKNASNQPLFSKQFTVNVEEIPVNRVELNAYEITLGITEVFDLNASVYKRHPKKDADETTVGDDNDVTFEVIKGTSTFTGDASVTATGGITGIDVGDVQVKVTSNEDASKVAVCLVHVVNKKPLVMSFSLPETINAYNRSTDERYMNEVNDQLYKTSDMNKGQFFEDDFDHTIYKVGNQGKFQFAPIAKARYYDAAGNIISTSEISNLNLKQEWQISNYDSVNEEWSEFADLASADLGTYIADYSNGEVEFENAAVGHRFKVKFTIEEGQNYLLNEDFQQEFTFQVKLGFNAYTVEGLSFFNNTSLGECINWAPVRSEAGLPSSIEGDVILHHDIAIDSSVFPENVLWTEEEVNQYLATATGRSDFAAWMNLMGLEDEEEAKELLYDSPNDFIDVFNRNTVTGQDFAVEGNFFKLDTSKMKQVKLGYENDPGSTLVSFQNGDGCHGEVFGINTKKSERAVDKKGSVSINNIKFVGNGGIESASSKANNAKEKADAETDPAKKAEYTSQYNRYLADVRLAKGGFIAFKIGDTAFSARNNINVGHFISFMSEQHPAHDDTIVDNNVSLKVDRLMAYDSYNSMFYFWASKDNEISNSYLTGAGGPLILMDEPNFGSDDISGANMQPVHAIAKNCYLNNPVAGTEPWFEQNHAATMVQSYLVNAGRPDIGDEGWIGSVAKASYNQSTTGSQASGLSKAEVEYAHANGAMSDQEYAALTTGIRTITNGNKKINFIAIYVHAHNFASNKYGQLTGTFEVKNNKTAGLEDNNNAKLDMSKTAKTLNEGVAVVEGLIGKNTGKIIAVSSLGGTAYIDNSNSLNVVDSKYAEFLGGNYMSYYLDPVLAAGDTTTLRGFVGAFLGTYSYYDNWVN